MITVKKLIKELQKFPQDAMCYAYEGEVRGVGVIKGKAYGFIHTGGENYSCKADKVKETELLTKQVEYYK